jgi:hypothetical protein
MSSSPLLQGSEKIDKKSAGQNRIVWFAKLDSPVFPNRAEPNTKELELQALIDISPPFVIKHQKVLVKSSRGFTHRRRLCLCFLQYFANLPEEGEMRMLQSCHHNQSRSR